MLLYGRLDNLTDFSRSTVREEFARDLERFAEDPGQQYFRHPKYLKLAGKPVIYLYATRAIRGEPADLAVAFTTARERVRNKGFELYIVADHLYWSDTSTTLASIGADAATMLHGVDLGEGVGNGPQDPPPIRTWADKVSGLYTDRLAALRSLSKTRLIDLMPGIFVQYDDSGLDQIECPRQDESGTFVPNRGVTMAYHLRGPGELANTIETAGLPHRWVAERTTITADCDATTETNGGRTSILWTYSFNEWAEGSGMEQLKPREPPYPFGFGTALLEEFASTVGATSVAEAPEPPRALGPVGTHEGLRPTFYWDGAQTADLYQLNVFNSLGGTVVDESLPGTLWTSGAALASGETHTWKVRAHNAAGWGAYSDVLSFTPTGPATSAPEPPVLLARSGCVASLRPAFSWAAAARAVDYKIAITRVVPDTLVIYMAVAGTSFVPPVDLVAGAEYRWRVKARNSVGDTWSLDPQMTFTPGCTSGPPPVISIADASVVEGTGGTTTGAFAVSLAPASAVTVTVAFATGGWSGANPAASAYDYTPVSGTLAFAPGETSKTIQVAIAADGLFEDHEKFVMNLSSPTNAVIGDGQGAMTIIADDSSNWRIKGVGDFNRDGKADIVWRWPPLASDPAQSGPNAVWRMDGATRQTAASLTPMNTYYETLSGVNDADGDGDADIWWRNTTTRQVRLWTQENELQVSSLYVTPDGSTLTDYDLVGVFDMGDGLYGPGPAPDTSPAAVATYDGKGDFVWRHKTSGALVVWYMNGYTRYNGIGETQAGLSDLNFRIVGAGDFNGDGRTDLVWQHAVTRKVVIWYMNGFRRLVNGDPACYDDGSGLTKCAKNTWPEEEEAPEWNVVGVGDFDADGKPDLLWRHYFSGSDAIWFMDGFERATPTRTLLTPNPFN